MKIGLFGGSFDPIHSGHLIAAEQILEKKVCDEVWVIPCYQNPLKKKSTEAIHRKKMIEIALKNKKNIKLNDFELNQKKPTYSVDSVRHFKKEFPEHTFFFVVGSKVLKEIKKWKNYNELLNEIKLIVLPNPVSEIPEEIKKFNPIELKPTISSNISSTLIRKKIKEKKDVSFLLPEKVSDYIKKNKLYA